MGLLPARSLRSHDPFCAGLFIVLVTALCTEMPARVTYVNEIPFVSIWSTNHYGVHWPKPWRFTLLKLALATSIRLCYDITSDVGLLPYMYTSILCPILLKNCIVLWNNDEFLNRGNKSPGTEQCTAIVIYCFNILISALHATDEVRHYDLFDMCMSAFIMCSEFRASSNMYGMIHLLYGACNFVAMQKCCYFVEKYWKIWPAYSFVLPFILLSIQGYSNKHVNFLIIIWRLHALNSAFFYRIFIIQGHWQAQRLTWYVISLHM